MLDLALPSAICERRDESQPDADRTAESVEIYGTFISIKAPSVRSAARLAQMLTAYECELFAAEPPSWRVQIVGIADVEPVLDTLRAWLQTEDVPVVTLLVDGETRVVVNPDA